MTEKYNIGKGFFLLLPGTPWVWVFSKADPKGLGLNSGQRGYFCSHSRTPTPSEGRWASGVPERFYAVVSGSVLISLQRITWAPSVKLEPMDTWKAEQEGECSIFPCHNPEMSWKKFNIAANTTSLLSLNVARVSSALYPPALRCGDRVALSTFKAGCISSPSIVLFLTKHVPKAVSGS